MDSGIYEIVNLVNGKRYVGSAKTIRQRWREHRSLLARGRHSSRHLQFSWNKYGAERFTFNRLLLCDPKNLIFFEQRALDILHPEYNTATRAGNTLGVLKSAETRAKIAAKRRGTKMPPRSEEYRAALSVRQRGKRLSPEQIAKMRATKLSLKLRLSEERKQQISAASKAMWKERRAEIMAARGPAWREKIASSLRGRKATPERRANQSAAQRGVKRGPYRTRRLSAAQQLELI